MGNVKMMMLLLLMMMMMMMMMIIIIIIISNWVLPSGCGTTIRHNTQITHITPGSNKTAHKSP
jgi:hypothetical protein